MEMGTEENPVLTSAKFILKDNPHVQVSQEGVSTAAKHVLAMMQEQNYLPATWRQQPLHPPPNLLKSQTKECLDWIFLVSALNFSFWSELEGKPTRYGVTWKKTWDDTSGETKKWEGYWSLLAALNKALERGIPITDPLFYASEDLCPDALIESIFQSADGCSESIPLLEERIRIMREVGKTFIEMIPGQSYMGLLNDIIFSEQPTGSKTRYLLNKVIEYFPSFRDESVYEGRKVVFWKRAQILIAETWAAFCPDDPCQPHPYLPDGVDYLTMFADYRVPQILQHLGLLTYSEALMQTLRLRSMLEYGNAIEVSIRAGSIVAVENVKNEMLKQHFSASARDTVTGHLQINCVLIDFFLWDLAKLMESGQYSTGRRSEVVPCHRTRSVQY